MPHIIRKPGILGGTTLAPSGRRSRALRRRTQPSASVSSLPAEWWGLRSGLSSSCPLVSTYGSEATAWLALPGARPRCRCKCPVASMGAPSPPAPPSFVAFDQHIQLTAVGEVIFRASRDQTQRPDRQQASGLQFTTDFGLRAAPLGGCRHINHGRARAECLGRSWRSGAGTRRGHEGLAWPRLGEARRTPA